MVVVSPADKAGRNTIELAQACAVEWQIFPATPDARKSYKSKAHNGVNWGATSDPDEIVRDFTRWPDARIGIPTGIGNNLVVVDTDTIEGHGVDGFIGRRELESKYGPLPETYQVLSPSGSTHDYFQHPGKGIKIPNSASVIAPGVDIRGDGGMVIGAGSVNPDGRSYRLINDLPIAPLPEAWIELVREKKPPRPTIRERATAAVNAHRLVRTIQSGGGSRYAHAALCKEIENLASATVGTRNAALNKSAFSLFQLVHAGLLKADEVERRLVDACVANGLVDDGLSSITATIRSAFNGAATKPRKGMA
jgi:hypothetical protein